MKLVNKSQFSSSKQSYCRLSSLSLPDGPFSPKDGQAEHTLSENDGDFQRPHKRSDTGVWEHRQRTAVQILAWDFRACWSEDWVRSHLPWPKGALRKEKRLGPRLSGYRTDVPRRIQKPWPDLSVTFSYQRPTSSELCLSFPRSSRTPAIVFVSCLQSWPQTSDIPSAAKSAQGSGRVCGWGMSRWPGRGRRAIPVWPATWGGRRWDQRRSSQPSPGKRSSPRPTAPGAQPTHGQAAWSPLSSMLDVRLLGPMGLIRTTERGSGWGAQQGHPREDNLKSGFPQPSQSAVEGT